MFLFAERCVLRIVSCSGEDVGGVIRGHIVFTACGAIQWTSASVVRDLSREQVANACLG